MKGLKKILELRPLKKNLKNNQNMKSFRKCSFQEIALLVSRMQLSGSNFHKKFVNPLFSGVTKKYNSLN